jgi:hypothetical protein
VKWVALVGGVLVLFLVLILVMPEDAPLSAPFWAVLIGAAAVGFALLRAR